MQAGLGVSRILFIVGAGYAGTIMVKNGKLSELLSDLQELLKGGQSEGEDPIAAQVRRLAMEVRQMGSARQIVLSGGSLQNGSSLLLPAAALGTLGYGYMWWKGISFSDLMYVTKQNMANAVSNLTKHLEHVSDALTATKKHLTQRIENLDDKLDSQVKMSKEIRSKVTDVSAGLSIANSNLDDLHRMVSGMDGKLNMLEFKQDLTNEGVAALCAFVASGKPIQFNEKFKELHKIVGISVPAITGLKEVVDASELEAKDSR